MQPEPRVLRVPDDLGAHTPHAHRTSAQGTVVSYLNAHGMSRQRVLVCAPMLVHVRHGTKRLELGGQAREVATGRVVLLRRGLHMMTEVLGSEGDPYASTLLCVSDAFLREFDARHPRHFEADGDLETWPVFEPGAYLSELLASLPRQLDALPHEGLIDLKVEEALLAMSAEAASRFWANAIAQARVEGDARLREAVSRHATTGVTVSELATLSGRSLSSFKRDFGRLYGVAPGKWLLHRRLELAATLLSARSCNVTEACWRAGFSDVSSFIRAFKRRYRTTPKQFQLSGVSEAS